MRRGSIVFAVQRRSSSRANVSLQCTLARRTGNPVQCQTLDVGDGGMRVRSQRPLSVDEMVHFSLSLRTSTIDGEARVLRLEAYNEYALRFEDLRADAEEILREVLPAA
jgi:c-di-GMP-binding flagellar brake protein YcgR